MPNKAADTINRKYDILMKRVDKIDKQDIKPAIPLKDLRSVLNKFRDKNYEKLLSTDDVANAVTSIASVTSAFDIPQYNQKEVSELNINTLKNLAIFYAPMAIRFFQRSLTIVVNRLMLKDRPKVKKIKADLVDKFEVAIDKIRDDIDSHNLLRGVARLSDLLTPVMKLSDKTLNKSGYSDAKNFIESLYINATVSVMFTAIVTVGNVYIEEPDKKDGQK